MKIGIIWQCLALILALIHAERYPKFSEYAKASKNASREKEVDSALSQAAGVYRNKTNAALEKTVIITVAAFGKTSNKYYKFYFKNFMCFMKHFKLDLIVYILHHDITNLEAEVKEISKLGGRALTYPDELFWKLVSTKKSHINKGKMLVSVIVSCIDLYKTGFGCADYTDSTPTFQSFGALVMLVPALEVMLHGYNVIYFDVDMGFVQDPIPFLTAGDADFVTSLGKVSFNSSSGCTINLYIYTVEIRRCSDYPSNNPLSTDWEKIEPNTGVMHLRATPQGISFYRAWLKRIVHFNALNDQKVCTVGQCF